MGEIWPPIMFIVICATLHTYTAPFTLTGQKLKYFKINVVLKYELSFFRIMMMQISLKCSNPDKYVV